MWNNTHCVCNRQTRFSESDNLIAWELSLSVKVIADSGFYHGYNFGWTVHEAVVEVEVGQIKSPNSIPNMNIKIVLLRKLLYYHHVL